MLKLTKLPIPPSQNKIYSSVRGRLIKSAIARKFDSDCEFWAYLRKRTVEAIKLNLEAIIANGGYLNVDCVFVFHKSKVLSKKGTLKRLDPANRLKCLHDNLAKILGIDDTYFVSGSFSKVICDDIKEEQVIVTISPASLDHFNNL
jgi:hypothetical protein